jgi:LemA protein
MFNILSGLGTPGIIIIIVAIVLVILVGWWISTSNKFKRMKIKIDEALSGIDVALTKRFDLLTKMLDTTKGYAKHETETLEKVIKWRNGIPANATMEEKSEFASSLSKVASGLNVVVENYPDLKANDMFGKLQAAIADTEEHLQAARRLYNSNVSTLNSTIVAFPTSIVANAIHIQKKSFFEAEEAKRQDVKMEF